MAFKMAGFSAFTKADDWKPDWLKKEKKPNEPRKTDRIPQVVQHMKEELEDLANKEGNILEDINQQRDGATKEQRNQLANLHQKQLKLRNKLKKYK